MRPIKLSSFSPSKFWHDLRFKRYRHRQLVGIVALLFVVGFAEPWRTPRLFWPGAVAVLLGVLIRLWASGDVKKDKVLATTGPYALVRHRLYLGNHLIMLGFCLTSGLWWRWLVWLAVTVLYYPPAIANEDERLHKLFGAYSIWRYAEVDSMMKRIAFTGGAVVALYLLSTYLYLPYRAWYSQAYSSLDPWKGPFNTAGFLFHALGLVAVRGGFVDDMGKRVDGANTAFGVEKT